MTAWLAWGGLSRAVDTVLFSAVLTAQQPLNVALLDAAPWASAQDRRALVGAVAETLGRQLGVSATALGTRLSFVVERSREGPDRLGSVLALRAQTRRGAHAVAVLGRVTGGAAGYFNAQGRRIADVADHGTSQGTVSRAALRARVSSGFASLRLHPILHRVQAHEGADYRAAAGTPVVASMDGTVRAAGWWGGYGIVVRLRHAGDLETRYGHLARVAPGLVPGLRVRAGTLIGWVGSTGLSTGPHLHYELRLHGQPVDPEQVQFGRRRTNPEARALPSYQEGLRRAEAWWICLDTATTSVSLEGATHE